MFTQGAANIAIAKKRLLQYLKPYHGWVIFIFIGLLIEMVFSSAVPFSFKFIVDKALLGNNKTILFYILGALGIGAIVVAIIGVGRDYLFAKLSSHILGDIRRNLFDQLQRLSIDFYTRSRSGDILSRFSNDLNLIEQATISAIPWAILPFLDVIGNTTLLFVLNWKLALLAMLIWPLIVIGPHKFAPLVANETYERKEKEAKILSMVQENVFAQPVMKIFNLTNYAVKKFFLHNAELTQRISRLGFYSTLLERSATVLIMLLHIMVIGVGSYLVMIKRLSMGSLASFQILFLSLSYSLSYMIQYIPILIQGMTGYRRIDEILDQPASIKNSPDPIPFTQLDSGIYFDKVTFNYPHRRKILKNVSLSIPKGKWVALVGSSGSGKSTILNFIMRFYDPKEGEVLIDKIPIQYINKESLYAKMACVFQDSFIFDMTIRENILLGNLNANEQEIENAAKAAELHDDIMNLPEGYDTMAGEKGGNLSGGQRQRLAIARAMVRSPDILILDEATSALDAETEHAVNATLERLTKGRTVLSVTHRLTSIMHADLIYVLDKGQIAEQGTHEQLISHDGLYHNLWNKQQGFHLSKKGDHALITIERLREIPLFNLLDDTLLTECRNKFMTDRREANSFVMHEGDMGNLFFIIVRGKVSVLKNTRHHTLKKIATLQDGDYFGEIALLENTPRTASIKTLTPCIFLTLDRGNFLTLVEKSPHLREKLEEMMLQRKQ